MKRFAVIMCIAFVTIMIAIIYFTNRNNNSMVEDRIIAAADEILSGEGECDIDLDKVFWDYEWDTVSIFVAGNTKQIKDALKVDNDVSDGIVFSSHGEPVMIEMSTYGFPEEKLPVVGYNVIKTQSNGLYYTTRLRDNSTVHIRKFVDKGEFKYTVYFVSYN